MGTKFKMEIKNGSECYIYVFGKETDGTSYTLFPYPSRDDQSKTRYSPFCGIAGYRLFPKDKSMTPDSIGTRDFIGVVVSSDSLNWFVLNKQISENPNLDYGSRIVKALGSRVVPHVRVQNTDKGNMQFNLDGPLKGAIACVIAIDK
jgi:hypothetical protein